MKVGILTSVDTRHRYFVHALHRQLDVTAVCYEKVGYNPATVDMADLSARESVIVTEHFAERARQEEKFFGPQSSFLAGDGTCLVRQVSAGTLSSAETVAFLESAGVDTVVVYGTNLIKPPLLEHWPGRTVNMHLGLSPYYRGTATNFYPLLNEEPQYVGATIHFIDAGIDSGPILRHCRPEIVAEDMPHTIGCKAIACGTGAMIAVLQDLEKGSITPVAQWRVPNGKLYRRKDYHPRQVVTLYRKLEDGLIRRYVENPPAAAASVRLIE